MVNKVSCHEGPSGSLLAFAWVDLANPIHAVTEWRSLSPLSFTCMLNSFPYGLPAFDKGEHTGLPCSFYHTSVI
ncbi:MAG: hypothetical protein NMK33_06195 (plasmid) [Candidatus Cardinium sp.]|uniref:hypothetical protein n=1 Tax=Cardinium endosymbiont of Dermatophagoides farinae TaxID=2597823 RepID=UPI001643338F|nr:hypothetical protein [Cardinium endosymbiont of Dermatophagoides farinae]UWW97635.1 MAG: hypothetical protein NMK33_06195 [Candidatus Cardinium sp.]